MLPDFDADIFRADVNSEAERANTCVAVLEAAVWFAWFGGNSEVAPRIGDALSRAFGALDVSSELAPESIVESAHRVQCIQNRLAEGEGGWGSCAQEMLEALAILSPDRAREVANALCLVGLTPVWPLTLRPSDASEADRALEDPVASASPDPKVVKET